MDLDGDEDFVVIACDGLWDFVSEDQVAIAVYWQIGADPGKSTCSSNNSQQHPFFRRNRRPYSFSGTGIGADCLCEHVRRDSLYI